MRDRIEAWMKLLVGTDTTNPPGGEKSLTDQLAELFTGCDGQRFVHSPNRESLVITLPGRNPNQVLGLAGHLDTVPVGNRELWKHNPFGEITGDTMYGRGTADMCGGLAAMLLILEEYKKHIPPETIKFFFTADEEADGTGAATLMEYGVFDDVNALILCEPSDLKLGISEKGTLWLKITVTGTSSHASMPEEGHNALQAGMDFANEIRQRISAFVEPHPLLGENTCEITGCKSGVKINIIPDHAVFELDIRTLPTLAGGNNTILQMINKVRHKYEDNENVKIDIEVLGNREAIEQPEASGFIRKLKQAIGDYDCCGTRGIYFYTDGSIIIPKIKIPFVIFGPGNPRQCHKADEHISLKQIEQCFYYYQQIIESYGRSGDESCEYNRFATNSV